MTYTELNVVARTKYFHVGNVEMFGYLDEARMVWYHYFFSLGVEAVVVHVNVDFKKEVFNGDKLYIRTFLERIGNTSFTLKQTVSNVQREEIALSEVVLATIDRDSRKKLRVPDQVRELLGKDCVLTFG